MNRPLAVLWACYLVCIAVAVLTYFDAPRLVYGFWSWLGGAFFTGLVFYYLPTLRRR